MAARLPGDRRRGRGPAALSAGWSRFPDPGGDHPGRVLWLLAEGEDARLAILDEHGDWHWDGGAKVGSSGGPYPSLCHEVLPPALPGGASDAHPEAAPGLLHVAPDRSGLGGHCLTLGPRGGHVASGMAKPDADLVAELWNDRLARLAGTH